WARRRKWTTSSAICTTAPSDATSSSKPSVPCRFSKRWRDSPSGNEWKHEKRLQKHPPQVRIRECRRVCKNRMSTPDGEVSNLTKVFSLGLKKEYVVAVDNLSFRVEAGEVYGLIGPNGSGKSTTMKVVLGLMAASKGSAKVFGLDSGDIRARNEIGFLPENPY